MLILDISIINISLYLSLALRFDNDIPIKYLHYLIYKQREEALYIFIAAPNTVYMI